MFVAMWVVLLLLLTAAFSMWTDGARNPNNDPLTRHSAGAVEVVLEENRQGHYWADGTINGAAVEFMVDTGATDVALPATLARELRLERGPSVQLRTANGVAQGFMTRLDRVTVGGIAVDNVRAVVSPGLNGGPILLGMSFLGELDFERRDGRLLLRQLRH